MTLTTAQRNKNRKFKSSHKGRYRPTTELNSKELVIDRILSSLYNGHIDFFNKRLLKLIEANMYATGHTGEARTHGILYAGRAWFVPWMEAKEDTDFLNLEVGPGIDETELLKVTTNLGELDVEMYEVKRFLAGLLRFSAPLEVMEKRLGRSLYNRVKGDLADVARQGTWNEATYKAFNDYAGKHDYLIDAMCKRIMMSMLSRTAFNQRT